VLNPSAVSLTAWAHYVGVRKDGQKVDDRALFTILCLRKQGKWSIFQAHKSLLLSYQGSETSKARPRLSKFCRGNGIDLGYGGDPIVPSAITLDLPNPYTKVGAYPQNLAGDAADLYWFRDNVLDYVYSSHLLEDFPPRQTAIVLREWLRVIKVGGVMILYGPDEPAYRAHCKEKGWPPNASHKVGNFGLEYVKELLEQNFRDRYSIVHEIELIDDYCFDLVVRKLK
jgi:predicted SAM-dependent methyltransferase